MKLTQKIKIYPTKEQKELLWELSDICRTIYNQCLDAKRLHYKLHKDEEKIPYLHKYQLAEACRNLRNIRYKKWNYLLARCVEQVIWKLDANYKSFFALLKKWKQNPQYTTKNGKQIPKNRPSLPRFKGWKYFTSLIYNQSGFKFKDNLVKFSHKHSNDIKLEFDISHYPLQYKGKIKQVELFREEPYKDNPSDFYISVVFDQNYKEYKDNGLYQAIDLGVKDLVTGVNLYSKFIDFHNIKNDKYWETKLKEINQKVSKCLGNKKGQKKSNQYKRLNKKRGRILKKRANQKRYYYHHVAKTLLTNTKANTIIIGDLNIKEMARKKKATGNKRENKANQTLNRRLFGVRMFIEFLKYKAEKDGKKIIEISEKNTTQMCCKCNTIKKGGEKLELKDRVYICDYCGNQIDRDKNSAINIMKRFLSYKSKGEYDFLSHERSVAEQSFCEKWFVAIHSPEICLQANAQ